MSRKNVVLVCLRSYFVVEELLTGEERQSKTERKVGDSPIALSPFAQGPPGIKLSGNSPLL